MDTILDTHARAVTSHQQYLDSLQTPDSVEVQRISAIQILKAEEINSKYHVHTTEERDAAIKIQAMYRGHRGRREQQGLILDPSSRWTELIAELKYRSVTEPHHNPRPAANVKGRRVPSSSETAKLNWRRAGWIAEHAGRGESPASSQRAASDMSDPSKSNDGQEEVASMLMDLRYFLEMVDSKHRYGANLQVYHEYWKRQETTQNFFYWLDHGPGKHLDLSLCSREKLDREQIRYLSREERKDYLVEVDDEGRLRWAKNGELITTSVDGFKDSTRGIVPVGTPDSPLSDQASLEANDVLAHDLKRLSLSGFSSNSSDDEESSSSKSSSSTQTDNKQPPPDKPKRSRRIHVSPATLLNHLLRSSVKPGTWIYVTDTLNRLYVGIKSSGSFQHASFLSGARIRSAGSISIEEGRLTYLSPLSGHYRPTTQSFRTFLESLDEQGVDLSGLKVSGALKVLRGMELYGRTKKGLTKVRRVGRREKNARGEGRKERMAVELVHEAEGVSATELVERHWEREHVHHHGRIRSKG